MADDLLKKEALTYFAPVAHMPGFPRALSRTLGELRMAGLDPARLTGHDASDDLSALLARAIEERQRVGAVDYATMLATATAELRSNPKLLADKNVVLLDIAIGSESEAALIHAVIASAQTVIATIPSGDAQTLAALDSTSRTQRTEAPKHPRTPFSVCSSICLQTTRRPRGAWTIQWCCSPRPGRAGKRSRSPGDS